MPLDITGVESTLKAMRKFDKDLTKQMNKDIKAVMLGIRDKARSDVPIGFPTYLSGWEKRGKVQSQAVFNTSGRVRKFPLFDTAEVTAGIVYRQGKSVQNKQGYRAQYYVRNNSPAGAIYETAGRVQPGKQGRVDPWSIEYLTMAVLHVITGRSEYEAIVHKYGGPLQAARMLSDRFDRYHARRPINFVC